MGHGDMKKKLLGLINDHKMHLSWFISNVESQCCKNVNTKSIFCPSHNIPFFGVDAEGSQVSLWSRHYLCNWTSYFSFGNSLAWIHNHRTKGLHLAMKYQKTPFEYPNTCPNLGHSNLLTPNYDLVLSIVSLQLVRLFILII
jgi:hypothetical protein